MKYRTLTILFLTVTVFGGWWNNRCSSGEKGCAVVYSGDLLKTEKDSTFFWFVQSIPYLTADFELNSDEEFKHVDLKSKFIPEGAALIGKLISIDNYAFIIYSYPADIRLPILEVYNSKGKKVNERALFKYGYCSLGDLGPMNKHKVSLSPDNTKLYLTTICPISFSSFHCDTIVIHDLIRH